MVAPEAPDDESLRVVLQETLTTYRQIFSQSIQMAGILTAAALAFVSYAFSQRIAVIILVATGFPIYILVSAAMTASEVGPLNDLVLRIERRLRIREDSLGATLARTTPGKMIPAAGSHIEDLTDEEVRHLDLKWELRWSGIAIICYTAIAVQIVLFVLSLTVFHYRFL